MVRSLVALGNVVVGFDPTEHGGDAAERTAALGALLAGTDAEWCVVIPTPGDLDPSMLRSTTAELGVVTLALHTSTSLQDAPTRLGEVPEHARCFDLVGVPHAGAAAEWYPYVRHGLVQIPPAVAPEVLDERFDGAVLARTVVCVGDADHRTAEAVRSLRDVGLDVGVLGTGWSDVADLRSCDLGRPDVRERSALLAAAEVVVELPPTLATLSVSGIPEREALLSQAALDAAALGTPVVALARPGVAEHLDADHEVLLADRMGDLPDLLRMVLSTPDLLRSVGLAAQERLRVEHQWQHRWTSLLDWLGADAPAQPIATTDGVTVVVPVAAGHAAAEVGRTVNSLLATETRRRVVVAGAPADLDRCLDAAVVEGQDVQRVDVATAAVSLLVAAGLAATTARYVAVAQPGTVWPAGRLDRQVQVLDEDPLVDAVVARHEHFDHFHRWDLLRRWVGAGSVHLAGAVVRRTALMDRVGPGLLAGRVDSINQVPAALRFRGVELEPLLEGPTAVPLTPELVDVGAVFPQLHRCEGIDPALAAAFTSMAADVADDRPDLARELCALALDHLEGGDEELAAVVSGAVSVQAEVLRQVEHRLGGELRAVAPTTEDQVWHQSGGTLANHRLVLDVDWEEPAPALRLIAGYSRRFVAGEPVELAILAEPGSVERVISVVAKSLAHDGIDIEAAANVTLLDRYERCDGDLVVRLRSTDSIEQAEAEAEAWMVETRVELDAIGV
ncbi:MAG: glycosyltransferase [Actinomycetota bacterium]